MREPNPNSPYELLTYDRIKEILESRHENPFQGLKDLPHPITLKNAMDAATLVVETMQKNGKILIVGDYDVDGMMSCIIMMKFFEMLTYKSANYIIPNRFRDGYGISIKLLENQLADLIITVDNGMSAFEAVDYCKQKNIPLIITDHHNPKEQIPDTLVVNPKQPGCNFVFKDICGASVAWYLCSAIKIHLKKLGINKNIFLTSLLQYVAIATISDVMPLIGINRVFVKKGLEQFSSSDSLCNKLLKGLIRNKNMQNLCATDISFFVTPTLNSAGRLENAGRVCEFFLTKDEKHIKDLFSSLIALNDERKNLTQSLYQTALHNATLHENCVISYGEDFHEGILGILSAKLSSHFNLPSFVFTKKENTFKGSGRSDGKIDLFRSLLAHSEEFIHFGGHAHAIGLTINQETLEKFHNLLKNPLKTTGKKSDVIGQLDPSMITPRLLDIIKDFEPYGEGNTLPKFLIKNLLITQSDVIKEKHQKLTFNHKIYGIEFNSATFFLKDERVDILASLELDFKNSLMLKIHSIVKAQITEP